MNITSDPWLAEIFGYPVFKISFDQNNDASQNVTIAEQVALHVRSQNQAFYYTKISTSQVDLIRYLNPVGMYIVDVNVRFGIQTESAKAICAPSEINVGEFVPEQYQAVLDIAANSFRYSRFHLDPHCQTVIANQIKHDWVSNYISDLRGECLFVASLDEKSVGFLAVLAIERDGEKIYTIDLIGAHNSFQGRGVGQALMAHFIDQYKDQCDCLQVGTQVSNIPSMRLYHKFGFFITQSQYVLHMHIRDGKPVT